MPYLNLDKYQTLYYKKTDGDLNKPCFVFLHEGLGCEKMWKSFPEELCLRTGCPGLVYDRIGYGQSTPLMSNRTVHYLHQYAFDELSVVLETLIPQRSYILVGHSDGASISLIHASQKPQNLIGVISMAAHVIVEPVTLEGIRIADDAWNSNKLDGLYKYHGDKTEQIFNAWAKTWLEPWFESWNIEYLLPSVDVPVLALQGGNDQYATEKQIQLIEEKVNGKVTPLLVRNCAHSLHTEATDKVSFLLMSRFILDVIFEIDL
jgi:pimeloyl-ACP methyl ester carboxylesterase